MTSPELTDQQLLSELTPKAVEFYARHITTVEPWYPHEMVPWSRGQDFEPGKLWAPDDSPIKELAVREALLVNLLTEDNLPYYFETINRMFGRDSIWKTWSHRWTAEENRHAIAIRDYVTVTRSIDPVALEDARMQQMSRGEVPQPETAVDGFVYVALQELATRIAHNKTGRKIADSEGKELMIRVGTDENFHHLFYRDITTEAIEIDPSKVVMAIERQVLDFEMPGTGITGFEDRAALIAVAGIFGAHEMFNNVYKPVLYGKWKIDKLEGLTPEAEQAIVKIDRRVKAIGRIAANKEADARGNYQESLVA